MATSSSPHPKTPYCTEYKSSSRVSRATIGEAAPCGATTTSVPKRTSVVSSDQYNLIEREDGGAQYDATLHLNLEVAFLNSY